MTLYSGRILLSASLRNQRTKIQATQFVLALIILLGINLALNSIGPSPVASETSFSNTIPTDGDSFSNAISLVVDEAQNRFITSLGANDDYWVIRMQNQLSPLILLNTSVSGYFDNFTVDVYDNLLQQVEIVSHDSEDPLYLEINEFQTTYFGDYYIVVSYNVTRKGNYEISIFSSEWGHSVDRPNLGAIDTVQTDFFSFEWMSEARYWRIPLNETQRCWLRFQETSPNVLEGTRIRVFRIPTNIITEETENGSGTVELTFRALGRGNYFIELI
ncbi:MAG: hypothetical protein ACXADX_14405, partial [Candidatus Hodarchaeales archaeon]